MTSGIVSTATLAGYFGVTARTIENLASSGVLVRIERGQFNLKDSVRRYCDHMRKQASGRAGAEATATARTKSLEASAKLKAAQTCATEARLRKQAGEVIEVAALENIVTGFFGLFRSTMLGLHPQITRSLHLPPAQDDTVRDVVYAALNQLAAADVLDGTNLVFDDGS